MLNHVSSQSTLKATGPYSQAVITNNLIFISGQLPIDAVTGEMPKTIREQASRSIQNIIDVLKSCNSSISDVVKTTIYLRDLSFLKDVNDIYDTYFNKPYPARSCVQVSRLPQDAEIEIEAIALRNI